KNETGYETLLQLSTDIQLSEDAYLSVDSFKQYTTGLIAILHIEEASVNEWLRTQDITSASNWISFWKGHFEAEDFYMGISNLVQIKPHENIIVLKTIADQTNLAVVAVPIVAYVHDK